MQFRDVEELLQTLEWPGQNLTLYREALNHSSYAYENQDENSNERLEFLGDAVLELIITEYFFEAFPEYPEGRLTLMRHRMVNEKSLAAIAGDLQLGSFLKLGKGEAQTGGSDKPSLLADAFEALAGALFLDLGYLKAKDLLLTLLAPNIKAVEEGLLPLTDYKTILQERCQSMFGTAPVYKIVGESGPPHARIFQAVVKISGNPAGTGEGKNKKEAEQSAAQDAWTNLSKDSGQ